MKEEIDLITELQNRFGGVVKISYLPESIRIVWTDGFNKMVSNFGLFQLYDKTEKKISLERAIDWFARDFRHSVVTR